MKQLAGIDNFFLKSETGQVYNHVASLGIYDPSTAPSGKVRFKEILEHFKKRLHVSPVFTSRLVTPPLGMDRPYWIGDPKIDVEFHIRHIALPKPGDWRQLMIQVARLHSRPLDRSRPLWEIYVIEGLDNIPGLPEGAFALFTKLHHSSVDGMAAAGLMGNLHSLSPAPDTRATVEHTIYSDREPILIEYVSRALGHVVDRAAGLSRFALRSSAKVAGIAGNLVRQQRDPNSGALDMDALRAAAGYGKAPYTRFNRKISGNRVVDAVGLPFADINRIRSKIAGATLNDVFLAVAGGTLHRYLKAKGELPDDSMRALMPISLRAAGEAAASKGGNEVGGVAVLLHTEIADPVARLHAIKRDVAKAKAGAELVGPDMVTSIYNELPFFVSNFLIKHLVLDQLNCTVSNVRGPDVPLYVAGARAVQFYPVSIPIDHVGVNFTGFSYNSTMWISAVACRSMVPDPDVLAQCMRDAFKELLDAALVPAEPMAGVRARSRKAPASEKPAPLKTRRRAIKLA
jgi:diacylglycerol O-acyltransferase